MLKFILQIVIMSSLGTVLYLMAQVLPRVSDEEIAPSSAFKPHWFIVYLEKVDEWALSFLEKFYRKARVWLMKLDNILSEKLKQFKKEAPKENKLSASVKTEENNVD